MKRLTAPFVILTIFASYILTTKAQTPLEKSDDKLVNKNPSNMTEEEKKKYSKIDLEKIAKVIKPEVEACKCVDENEIKLLTELRRRRKELDNRAQLILQREQLLDQLETDLDDRIKKAIARVSVVEDRLGLGETARMEDEKRLAHIIGTLRSISARKAAPILENSHPRFVVVILQRLEPELTGELLAKMTPERAASLVQAMAPKNMTKSKSKSQPQLRRNRKANDKARGR